MQTLEVLAPEPLELKIFAKEWNQQFDTNTYGPPENEHETRKIKPIVKKNHLPKL